MILRPYQQELVEGARRSLKSSRSVLMQLPTGGGKTAVFSAITQLANLRDNIVWIITPRSELMDQASLHLTKYNVSHGLIRPGSKESRAYGVHIASKSTLQRRWDQIKRWPKLIIVDEAHVNYKFQMDMLKRIPEKTKVIGVTATPERLSGEGLSDIYDSIIYGPNIAELVSLGFLSDMRYFSPPLPGLEEIHRKGTEYNPDELAELFQKRQVYGNAIKHYRKYANGKPALVFTRSIKAAEETAARFREAGYNFENVDGTMGAKKRRTIIDGLKDGRLQGLVSAEILLYGFDCPRVECIIILRPTLSRALFFQMIGRGLRPSGDKCVILDHCGLLSEHGHPLEHHEWQWNGTEKTGKKRGIDPAALRLCPRCFLYFITPPCPNCGSDALKPKKPMKEIDGRLVEIEGPVKLNDRPDEERREYVDRINADVAAYQEAERTGEIDESAVADLLKAAEELGRGAMWVYWTLSSTYLDKDGVRVPRKSVNSPLLYCLGRLKGYKQGWAWMKKDEIRKRINSNDAEVEMFRREVG